MSNVTHIDRHGRTTRRPAAAVTLQGAYTAGDSDAIEMRALRAQERGLAAKLQAVRDRIDQLGQTGGQ